MQYKQGSVAATVLAVQGFIDKYAERLGPIPQCGARKRLDEIGVTLDTDGRVQQDRALVAQLATRKRIEARQALINDHMHPIAQVAAAEIPNFGELTAFHMPRLNVNDKTLIQSARAMASAATGYTDLFSAGLADGNFVAELEQAAEVLVTALKERVDSIATQQKATAGLAADYRLARYRIRVLDRLVMKRIKSDAGLVAEWKRVRRVAKKAGAPRTIVTPEDEAPATGTPVTPAPVTPAPVTAAPVITPPAVSQAA